METKHTIKKSSKNFLKFFFLIFWSNFLIEIFLHKTFCAAYWIFYVSTSLFMSQPFPFHIPFHEYSIILFLPLVSWLLLSLSHTHKPKTLNFWHSYYDHEFGPKKGLLALIENVKSESEKWKGFQWGGPINPHCESERAKESVTPNFQGEISLMHSYWPPALKLIGKKESNQIEKI